MSEVTAAPAEAVAPSQPNQPAAPKEPTNPFAPVEEALKKAGGLKVRAGGREHTIDSLEKAVRLIQRGLPVEESLQQVAKERAEFEPIKAKFAKLREAGDDEAIEELRELLGDRFDRLAETRLRKQYEKEKSLEGMSEREKQLARELEQERASKAETERKQKALEKEQQDRHHKAQVEAVKEHIGGAIVATLKALDLPDKLEPMAVDFMKPIMRAALKAGVPLDPALLAERVRPMFDQLFEFQMRGLDGEKLVKKLGDDVGKRYRQALLAQLTGGQPPQPKTTTEQPKAPQKWDPRRIF